VWRGVVVAVCLAAAACGSGEGDGNTGTTAGSGATSGGLTIEYRSEPSPPTTGENALEVTVRGPDGAPVTDATISVEFSMPAMPSMNMPAMRSEATLTHAGAGRYSGTGRLSMGGTWNVTVRVSRGTEEIGSRRFSVVAR
jgi:hypothetical protein